MWKDFFYYSKSERRAVYVLLVLLLLFSVGVVLAPERKSQVSSSDAAIDSLDLKFFPAKGTRKEKTDS
ncbi:MAG: helix-hairpin-helix domain-containing protein, partial [Parabacteroides sp.]|nr:helix-hairpin-helix domain-containing protein [Parabacteroides sp.]